MSVLDIIEIELTGIAVVKLTKTVRLSSSSAKSILNDDSAMMSLLTEGKELDVREWDVVYGERQNQTPVEPENQVKVIGA